MTPALSPEKVAELRRLDAEATPMVNIVGAWGLVWRRVTGRHKDDGPLMSIPPRDTDADMVIQKALEELDALRNALPALLDAVEERDALRECLTLTAEKRVEAEEERDRLRVEVAKFVHLAGVAVHSPDQGDLARYLSARAIVEALIQP